MSPDREALLQLEDLGFDALASDLLRGPAPVLTWLANEHSLGRTVRSTLSLSHSIQKGLAYIFLPLVPRPQPLQLSKRPLADEDIKRVRGINRYYTLEGSVSVKYSHYGQRKAQTEIRSLPAAKILSGGGENP